jgi:ribokinase
MVVTLGDKGAFVLEKGIVTHLPALKVKAVDTTGAGDVFNAALVVGLGEKMTLLEATAFALKASGVSVSKDYVLPSIPNRKDLD